LEYFTKLQKVETKNIEITSQVTGLENVTREDRAEDFGNEKELIDCAPEEEGGQIKVKAVL